MKSEPPGFICQLFVTVVRKPDCSLTIREQILFPHTTDTEFLRTFPKVPDLQIIKDVVVTTGDKSVLRTEFNDDASAREVEAGFETADTASPIEYDLRYTVSNGAMRFSRTCGETDGQKDDKANALRYGGGSFDRVIDQVTVSFSSEVEGAKLEFINPNGEPETPDSSANPANTFVATIEDGIAVVKAAKVTDNIVLFVKESGVAVCKQDLVCYSSGFPKWTIALIILGGLLLFIGIIIAVCTYRKKKSVRRTRVSTTDPFAGPNGA